MPDPFDTNDDWAELARELARDKPPAPPAPPADRVERLIEAESVEPHHGDPRAEDEAAAEGEPEAVADEEFDDAEDAPAGETGEAPAEGEQPGTGRKRRRRRRRRRKGAPETATPVSAEGEGGTDEDLAPEPIAEPEGDDFGEGVAEADSEPLPFGAEEDTASEVLRDLIANWNVPSWDDIVSGLYRPN
jgi:ribonuclease E